MKKKILLVLLTIALAVGIISAVTIVVGAETTTPEMDIAYCNISFRDSVCIKYAVKSNASDVKILIWTSPEEEYTVGTHDGEITEYYTEEISGVEHMIFDYTELSAKQMGDVVYARAYAKVEGVDYYSEVNKYSILQYAYNKLGKTATASTNAELKEMLTNMLAYGASAQKYFDYKEDRLATAQWYQVALTAGTLADGSQQGIYLPGDKVTLVAPATDANGEVFSHWADSNGNKITTTTTFELIVKTANEVYTPVYTHTVVVDAAVAPTCNTTGLTEGSHCSVCGEVIVAQEVIAATGEHSVVIDKAVAPTCNATGLTEGSHCSACGEVIVAQEVIAATGEHNFGKWVTVKEATTTEEGLMERTCDCGTKETQTIEKIIPELAYTLNDDGQSYSVTGIGTWTDPELVIPDTYKGLPVTSIGSEAFYDCDNLTSVIISDNISSVNANAFGNCSNLVNVTLGDNVESIYDGAFANCSSLTSIIIPDSVTSIGSSTFIYCYNLVSVTLGNSVTSIGNNAFLSCHKLVEVINKSDLDINTASFNNGYVGRYAKEVHAGTTKIVNQNDYLFYTYNGANYLLGYTGTDTDLILPKNYNGEDYEIYRYAFSYCFRLTSATIEANIGDYAFYRCSNLTTVTIGEGVRSIGYSAFSECANLTSVTIGNDVKKIDRFVFSGCGSLASITFKDTDFWYRTEDASKWSNMTGGSSTSLSDSSKNVTYFTSSYYTNYYWYKS